MKFPTPATAYDENGVVACLTGAIKKAGSDLHAIVEEPSGSGSKEILARAATVAAALHAEHLKMTRFIMNGVLRRTVTMSTSALAAMMDLNGFAADIFDAVEELADDEPDVALDVIRDIAFEMTTHDHAKSAAEWIAATE